VRSPISRRVVLASASAAVSALLASSLGLSSVACAGAEPWSAAYPAIAERVRSGGVLTVHMVVPLCHEDQVACGGMRAGAPGDLAHNLYWGAVFGHDRFLSRKASAWRRIGGSEVTGSHLARSVFGRSFAGAPFGRAEPIDVVVVLDAFHGDAIDAVVDRFFAETERGAEVTFTSSGTARRLSVDVVGYAGHNRMLDGKQAPAIGPVATRRPVPSFVLACRSHQTFAGPLAARGSSLLVAARDLVAPEGYVLDAVVDGLARNEAAASIRQRAVRAYAHWQHLEPKVAGTIFAPAP
jgi:hypothetical protein